MNYTIGQFLSIGQKDIKYQLLAYKGEWRRKSDSVRIFKVAKEQVTEDGREHAYYEAWECLNLNTGQVEIKKLPVYIFNEQPDDYIYTDRREVINDSNEVTSLLDHYSCWESGNRDRMNFHLDIINDRHVEQIARLRDLDNQDLPTNYKVGIRLKLIQKEHPNLVTRRNFITWGKEYPDLLTKLIDYVYKNDGNNNVTNTI